MTKGAPPDPVEAAAIDWFVRRRDGLTAAEAAAFADWLAEGPAHAQAFAEIAAMWRGLDAAAPPPLALTTDARPPEPARRQWRWAALAGLAACGLLAVSGPWLRDLALADARTGVGDVRTLRLSDGTLVSLDAESAVAVAIGADERRIRLLRGRAWFQVAHEARPFLVRVGGGQVRDIGTAFEVADRDGGGSVAVAQGSVELTLNDGPALRLSAGQGARFDRAGPPRAIAPPPRIAAWREGRLQFVNTPLGEVLADLRRYGAGWAPVGGALARRRISGSVSIARPEAAMDAVLALAGARARRLGPLVLVEGPHS